MLVTVTLLEIAVTHQGVVPHFGGILCNSECVTSSFNISGGYQSGADSTINNLSDFTYIQASVSEAETRDTGNSNYLNCDISGSWQSNPYKGSFGNYSLYSFKEATSSSLTPPQVNNEKPNYRISSGLHVQWGLLLASPLLALPDTSGKLIKHSSMEQWVQLAFKEASKHSIPNYAGARVKVISQLNVPQWRALLKDYEYNRVIDYIEFGFPRHLIMTCFSTMSRWKTTPQLLSSRHTWMIIYKQRRNSKQ